jgi:tripartite-type tricarboxylate transporter receptor subunit TctC
VNLLKKMALGVLLSAAAILALAQGYPEKPIRLLVPYTTGGGTDLMARILGKKLSPSLGQPVVIENKPGAGGVIATDMVAKAPPDGYTLGLISSGHAINPSLYSKLPFDPVTGIAPVIQVASGPNVIVVNKDVPAKTLQELIAAIRSEPGHYSFGSAGVGNPTHLAGEAFARQTNTRLIHVPYKGSGQAEIALAGGEITMIIDSIPAALPFINSGKTRALAVTGKNRFALLPNVPTAAEAGLPDFEPITWWGIIAPPGTPHNIVAQLNAAAADALQSPDVRQQFLKFGAEPTTSTPEQFGAFIKSETERFGKLVHELGIHLMP